MAIPSNTAEEAKERQSLMLLMNEGEFAIPNRMVDENLLLATWNIKHFSEKKTWRSIKYISDIIERFDIVALQELMPDLRGLERLYKMLPGDYSVLVSDPSGNNERFAFIYDKRTIKPTGLVCEITFEYNRETEEGFQIHRTPYCASFRAGRFDFNVVNVHIFQGDSDLREKEIGEIAHAVKKHSTMQQDKVFERDIFIVGDFNIDKKNDRYYKALSAFGFHLPEAMDDLGTNFKRDKTFDKIVWTDRDGFEWTGRSNVVPFNKVVYQDKKPKGGRNEISDHLPLWAEFRINALEQELERDMNT